MRSSILCPVKRRTTTRATVAVATVVMVTQIPIMRIPTFAALIVVHTALLTWRIGDIFINRPYLSTFSFNVVVSIPVVYLFNVPVGFHINSIMFYIDLDTWWHCSVRTWNRAKPRLIFWVNFSFHLRRHIAVVNSWSCLQSFTSAVCSESISGNHMTIDVGVIGFHLNISCCYTIIRCHTLSHHCCCKHRVE